MSLSSLLGTLPFSSGVYAIKSTHSCVKSRTYLEICFASIPGASSYYYYAPRSLLRVTFISLNVATYYKEHLFFYEVVSRKITFIHVPRGGPLSVTHSKKIHARLHVPRDRYMSLVPQAMTRVPSFPRKWIPYPLHIPVCSTIQILFFALQCSLLSREPNRSSRCISRSDNGWWPYLFSRSCFLFKKLFKVLIPYSRRPLPLKFLISSSRCSRCPHLQGDVSFLQYIWLRNLFHLRGTSRHFLMLFWSRGHVSLLETRSKVLILGYPFFPMDWSLLGTPTSFRGPNRLLEKSLEVLILSSRCQLSFSFWGFVSLFKANVCLTHHIFKYFRAPLELALPGMT